ncbi:MAG: Pseudogene of type I restriction endonuclease subunit R [Methanobrevibacter sp. CfCl-M3]
MMPNKELFNKVAKNSRENVEAIDKYLNNELIRLFNSNIILYKKINENGKLKAQLKEYLLDLVYRQKEKSLLMENSGMF